MRNPLFIFVGLLALAMTTVANATEPFDFVSEYIREIGAVENIRARAEAEMTGTTSDKMASCVRNSTRFQLELASQSAKMRGINLAPPLNWLPSSIATPYDDKDAIHEKFSATCSEFMAGPKLNINYGTLVAEEAKLTAQLEFLDKALFEVTPAVFAALINPVPDAQNHMSRLVITASDRDDLVRSLEMEFGKKLDDPSPNYIVSAGAVLKYYLTKKGCTTK